MKLLFTDLIFLILAISLLLLDIFVPFLSFGKPKSEKYTHHRDNPLLVSDGNMDTKDLPALNYFTLPEPDYFFYDPEVYGDDHYIFSEGHSQNSAPSPVYPSSRATTVNDVFGKDNFLRFYSDDM